MALIDGLKWGAVSDGGISVRNACFQGNGVI